MLQCIHLSKIECMHAQLHWSHTAFWFIMYENILLVNHIELARKEKKTSPSSCNKDYKFMNLLHDYQTSSKFILSYNARINMHFDSRHNTKITKESSKCSDRAYVTAVMRARSLWAWNFFLFSFQFRLQNCR